MPGFNPQADDGPGRGQSETARLRREQIINAAVEVITEKGLQHLSLKAIEDKADMSRGQLTYYFSEKEHILLAVFDRLLALMFRRIEEELGVGECGELSFSERFGYMMRSVVLGPPVRNQELFALEHTFLSQIWHRPDFRERLARLYGDWRGHMAADMAKQFAERGEQPGVPPAALAAVIVAIVHGLSVQLTADPAAFDRDAVLKLCMDLLGPVVAGGRPAGAGGGEHGERC